jgi:phosphatidylethanolamine-binding protein (PEBP) family uncharacterized protein
MNITAVGTQCNVAAYMIVSLGQTKGQGLQSPRIPKGFGLHSLATGIHDLQQRGPEGPSPPNASPGAYTMSNLWYSGRYHQYQVFVCV